MKQIIVDINIALRRLIHTCFELSLNDLVLGNDPDDGTPAAVSVSVDGSEKDLGNDLKQFLRLHIGFVPKNESREEDVHGLARTVEVLCAGARDGVVVLHGIGASSVEGAQEGFAILRMKRERTPYLVQTSDDGLDEIGSEASGIELVLHESCECLGGNVTVLTELVEVHFVFEILGEGDGVGLKAREADEEVVAHLIHLLAVHCYGFVLCSETEIARHRGNQTG